MPTDSTDVRFNNDELELPEGVESTKEVMAKQGVWVDGDEAVRQLTAVLAC